MMLYELFFSHFTSESAIDRKMKKMIRSAFILAIKDTMRYLIPTYVRTLDQETASFKSRKINSDDTKKYKLDK